LATRSLAMRHALAQAARTARQATRCPPSNDSKTFVPRDHIVGYQLITPRLKKYGLAQRMPLNRAILELFYVDPAATHFCSGSYPRAMRIRWSFSRKSRHSRNPCNRDFIRAHDYLSHIVPHIRIWIDHARKLARCGLRDERSIDSLTANWRGPVGPVQSGSYDHYLKICKHFRKPRPSVRYRGPVGLEDQAPGCTRGAPSVLYSHLHVLTQPDYSRGRRRYPMAYE